MLVKGLAAPDSPFPQAHFIRLSSRTRSRPEAVYVAVSADISLLKVNDGTRAPPSKLEHFRECDWRIELSRSKRPLQTNRDGQYFGRPFDEVEAATDDIVAVEPGYHDCAVRLTCRIRSKTKWRKLVDEVVVLVAESPSTRDEWLLRLCIRLAPLSLLCRICTRLVRRQAKCSGDGAETPSPALVVLRNLLRSASAGSTSLVKDGGTFGDLRFHTLSAKSYNEANDFRTIHVTDAQNVVAQEEYTVQTVTLQALASYCRTAEMIARLLPQSRRVQSVVVACNLIYRRMLCVLTDAFATQIPDADLALELFSLLCQYWACMMQAEASVMRLNSTKSHEIDPDVVLPELEAALETLRPSMRAMTSRTLPLRFNLDNPAARPRIDGAYVPSFALHPSVVHVMSEKASPSAESITRTLLDHGRHDSAEVGLVCVVGHSGTGKTTACALATQNPLVQAKFPDGALWIQVGREASEKRLLVEVAQIVNQCNAPRTSHNVQKQTSLSQAVGIAGDFFKDRRILLVLDNVWEPRDSRVKSWSTALLPLASGDGSCVILTTSTPDRTCPPRAIRLEVDCLALNEERDRRAAIALFDFYLGMSSEDPLYDEAARDAALEETGGLPIGIAARASLIRKRSSWPVRTRRSNEHSAHGPGAHDDRSFFWRRGRIGLFRTMDRSLAFLDRNTTLLAEGESMTVLYGTLAAIPRSSAWVTLGCLRCAWSRPADEAVRIAEELAEIGLVRLRRTRDPELSDEDFALSLHDLHREHCARICQQERAGISQAGAHERFVAGMCGVNTFDSGNTNFREMCNTLKQQLGTNAASAAQYACTNLVRHVLGSLVPGGVANLSARKATLLGLLTCFDWIMLRANANSRSELLQDFASVFDWISATNRASDTAVFDEGELTVLLCVFAAVEKLNQGSWIGKPSTPHECTASVFYRYFHAFSRHAGLDEQWEHVKNALETAISHVDVSWLQPVSTCNRPSPFVRSAVASMRSRPSNLRVFVRVFADGALAATSSADGSVRILRSSTGAVVRQHKLHDGPVSGLAVGGPQQDTANSTTVYMIFSSSCCALGTVAMWRVTVKSEKNRLDVTFGVPRIVFSCTSPLYDVACSRDGDIVLVSGDAGYMTAWRRTLPGSKYDLALNLNREGKSVSAIALVEDGSATLTGFSDEDGRLQYLSPDYNEIIGEIALTTKNEIPSIVRACAFAESGRIALTGHDGGVVCMWHVPKRPFPKARSSTLYPHATLALTQGPAPFLKYQNNLPPAVSTLAVVGETGNGVLIGQEDGAVSRLYRVSDASSVSDSDQSIGFGSSAWSVVRRDSELDKQWKGEFAAHPNVAAALEAQAKAGRKRDADPGESAGADALESSEHHSPIVSVSVSRCGGFVASGSEDGSVSLWDGSSGRVLWTRVVDSTITAVCASDDGSRVVAGSRGGCIRVWGTDGSEVQSWKYHETTILVAISKSDGFIWSSHEDGAIVVWREGKDEAVGTLDGFFSLPATACVLSSDGSVFAPVVRDHGAAVIESGDLGIASVALLPDVCRADEVLESVRRRHPISNWRTVCPARGRVELSFQLDKSDTTLEVDCESSSNRVIVREARKADPGSFTTLVDTKLDEKVRTVDCTKLGGEQACRTPAALLVCGMWSGTVYIFRLVRPGPSTALECRPNR